MEKTLDHLIRDASKRAAKNLHRQGGQPITFIGYRADGEIGFMIDQQTMLELGIGPAEDKDFVVFVVKNFLKTLGCTQLVTLSEAWRVRHPLGDGPVDEKEFEKAFPAGLEDHPERVDIIHYMAEDYDGNRLCGDQSIIRPAGAKPYLDNDLEIVDAKGMKGRMTGFFDKNVGNGLRKAIIGARERMAGGGRWVDGS